MVGRRLAGRTPRPGTDDLIVRQLPLPRALLAALTGAGLGVVGTGVQALVRNPLADPYLLGVSNGASLGAVAAIVLGVGSGGVLGLGLSGAAFAGAFGSFVRVWLVARRGGRYSPLRLVLVGVAIGQFLSGFCSYLVLQAGDEQQTRGVLFWLMGSLGVPPGGCSSCPPSRARGVGAAAGAGPCAQRPRGGRRGGRRSRRVGRAAALGAVPRHQPRLSRSRPPAAARFRPATARRAATVPPRVVGSRVRPTARPSARSRTPARCPRAPRSRCSCRAGRRTTAGRRPRPVTTGRPAFPAEGASFRSRISPPRGRQPPDGPDRRCTRPVRRRRHGRPAGRRGRRRARRSGTTAPAAQAGPAAWAPR